MDFGSGSAKNLLNDYHRLAADTLLGDGARTDHAVMEAAEEGQLERLKTLITRLPSSVNVRCLISGDTPLISAAREGHMDVVELLLKHGADVTVQNDADETALDVCSEEMRKVILGSIQHEDRAMSNVQALLHSAWLGDAVSVKKSLESGKNYLNVNCHNKDGVTPLLLVTRDIRLFNQVQSAMENEYDPVTVMQDLINNHADVNICDKKGRSALHLVASSENVHARKMVSILLRSGSLAGSVDNEEYSPLHVASNEGHTAIIVALVEEGGADVNFRGGERKDTPLMLSARSGHGEAAKYLISQGADVTAVDKYGDTAITVAKSPSMIRLLKEAWVEQTHSPSSSPTASPSPECSPERSPTSSATELSLLSPSIVLTRPSHSFADVSSRGWDTITPMAEEDKFFLTEGKIRRKSSDSDCPEPMPSANRPLDHPTFEVEADDEQEAEPESRRVKPPNRRAHMRNILSKRNAEKEKKDKQRPIARGHGRTGSLSLLHSEPELFTTTSADEGNWQQPTRTGKLFSQTDDTKTGDVANKASGSPRPSCLTLHRGSEPTLSRSFESLFSERTHLGRQEKRGDSNRQGDMASLKLEKKGDNMTMASPKLEKISIANNLLKSPLLPNVVKSPTVSPLAKSHKPPPPSQHLPSLTNMHPVAILVVDADSERLTMQRFGQGKGPNRGSRQETLLVARTPGSKSNTSKSFQRSKSLLNFKKDGCNQWSVAKRNSTGSVYPHKTESKVPLLPSVVTSQFGFGIQGGGVGVALDNKSKGCGGPNKASALSPTCSLTKVAPKLGVVTEVKAEAFAELKSAETFSRSSFGSKDSTLKYSDFEVDSLEQEQEIVLLTTKSSPRPPYAKGEVPNGTAAAKPLEQKLALPPHNPNSMINYADPHGSAPLSPIWNQLQYFRTESETSTNSEYITSFLGGQTPLPDVLSPDYNNKSLAGIPPTTTTTTTTPSQARGGSSSDSDPGKELSSGESGEEGGEAKESCFKWKRGRLLGKGAYGKVWEGLLSSAKMIAVKEVGLDTENLERAQSQYKKIQMEVDILRAMKHRNIVSYLGTSMHMATVYIFMQYISGGSLQSIIKRFGALDGSTVAHYTRQITSALRYLHDNGIIHRDIKGANIMVNSRGVVKLIDFGCAKNCQDFASNMHSVRGTPYWMAPEVICGYGYGRKSDIWSLGCSVLEMATGKPPWAEYPPEAAMFQIGMGKPIPRLPDHLPTILTDFFYLCMTRDQKDRPTAQDLLEHKFLENHSR